MSKHGYHKGTVLIACPSCKNRHIIADHLGIFLDDKTTLEDILAKQGTKVTKGHVEGDMEFWEDGSVYKTGISQEEPSDAGTKESS
jgi:protein import protein ZIM17